VDQRIIDLTTELVAIPTHEVEDEAQALLASWLEPIGFDCVRQEIAPGRVNLIARRGSAGAFLCSHIDVHPPHGHPDPWRCRHVGGHLVGRGVVDTKGLIAALVAALETEREADALVVITCDEERGGLGSTNLALPDGPWFSEGGIVLEPTDFRICTAQAGNIDVKVEVSGTPAHAYADPPSASPVTAVLDVIAKLDTCSFLKAEHPLVGRPRTNVGRLRGGEHPWRTPGRARLEMTLGVVPGTDFAAAVAEVRGRLDDVARRWGEAGTSFLYEIVDVSEPTEVASDLPIAKRLADAIGTPLRASGIPAWTDAGYLFLEHGLPCVVFGAGDLASAHSNHEWVAVDDLVRLCSVLRRLLTPA
jgi:acetylornithine deacetylase/succinyl-diaminopimelate desuccinylase-like protein